MAIQPAAQNTYQAVGIREDLTSIVSLIDPQETPFISNIGNGKPATAVKHEWQVQNLTAPNKSNFQLEGDDTPAATTAVARQRIYNYCAISRKVGSVTGTMRAVDVAGIEDEYDNQEMLKAIELRRDMEVIVLDNNKYETGGTATVRECAGFAAYITNTDFTGAQNFTAATGDGASAWNLSATTTRSLSLTILNGAVQAAHIDGGKPNLLMLSPTQRTAFSNLTLQSSLGGAAQVRYNTSAVKPMALIGTVDTWLSNFGQLDVASNVQMASDSGFENITAYMVDTRHVGLSYLRRMSSEPLAKTGDADKFQILAEYTLEVDAPQAHAALFALA
jgi:hypothetical protein